jgi:hypothetical protein
MTTVRRERIREGIDLVTLDRPERLNAMNTALIEDLHTTLDAIAVDPTCRVVILTGAGRGFCSGLDLGEPAVSPQAAGAGRTQAGMHTQQMIASLVPKLRGLRRPVIAAVNGAAAGGGLALALASDIRIGGASCRFNVAFVRIGLSGCDIGVSWLLPRVIGSGRAFELLLTGRMVVIGCLPSGPRGRERFDASGQPVEAEPFGPGAEVVGRPGPAPVVDGPHRRIDAQGGEVLEEPGVLDPRLERGGEPRRAAHRHRPGGRVERDGLEVEVVGQDGRR